MKLRAEISIELEAADFVGAAEHQRRIEELHNQVRQTYPAAVMVLRERKERERARKIQAGGGALPPVTGRLNTYRD